MSELNSANRTRAIGIRDLRRSEVQLVMHRTCAHLRGCIGDTCHHERVGEAARINSFTEDAG